ncbi:MAG: hypothetical protein KDJ26_00800 [Alphaproteobacteria bacterium]|nr:hypothetical protein [Alphaproteobacteria bacterium]MCB1550516.1 hypothetical protein [Alphaproteobacteria bacterium]MCB9985155.1 hypothetical protein [Micavibrio sp.]HPQ50497.1 hypothetical protein [Alphaproteobacteria bacterium]HRK98051.1 hypothetical protein [Alphaproteobacteria bacterium]
MTQPTTPHQTRAQSLDQIRTLIRMHDLKMVDLFPLIDTETNTENSGNMLQRVMIYIGSAFIFMGICVYIGMIWDDMDSLSRVILTLGSGFIAFILGLFALGDKKFDKASTPLFLVASALEPTGLFVFMDEYLPHTGDIAKAAMIVFAFMAIQKTVAFSATKKTSLLFFSVLFFFAFLYSLISWLDLDEPSSVMTMGISMLMISWGITRTKHHAITPFYYFWGSIMTAAASFDFLKDSPLDIFLIGVSATIIYLSTLASSRTLLTIGVLSLLAYLGYFTDEYFKDIVGWPIALIVLGLMMIGISVFAVKLGKKIAKQEA